MRPIYHVRSLYPPAPVLQATGLMLSEEGLL